MGKKGKIKFEISGLVGRPCPSNGFLVDFCQTLAWLNFLFALYCFFKRVYKLGFNFLDFKIWCI